MDGLEEGDVVMPPPADPTKAMRVGPNAFVPAITRTQMDIWDLTANEDLVDTTRKEPPKNRPLPAHVKRFNMTDKEWDQMHQTSAAGTPPDDHDDTDLLGEAVASDDADKNEDDEDGAEPEGSDDDEDSGVDVPDILTELPAGFTEITNAPEPSHLPTASDLLADLEEDDLEEDDEDNTEEGDERGTGNDKDDFDGFTSTGDVSSSSSGPPLVSARDVDTLLSAEPFGDDAVELDEFLAAPVPLPHTGVVRDPLEVAATQRAGSSRSSRVSRMSRVSRRSGGSQPADTLSVSSGLVRRTTRSASQRAELARAHLRMTRREQIAQQKRRLQHRKILCVRQLSRMMQVYPQAAKEHGLDIRKINLMTYDEINQLIILFSTGVGARDRIEAAKGEGTRYAMLVNGIARVFKLSSERHSKGFMKRVETELNKESNRPMLFRYGAKYASSKPEDPRLAMAKTIGAAWLHNNDFRFMGRLQGLAKMGMQMAGLRKKNEYDDDNNDDDDTDTASDSESAGGEKEESHTPREAAASRDKRRRRRGRRRRREGTSSGGGNFDLGSLMTSAAPMMQSVMSMMQGGGADEDSDSSSGPDESLREEGDAGLGIEEFDANQLDGLMSSGLKD